jgi:hypothetical protein
MSSPGKIEYSTSRRGASTKKIQPRILEVYQNDGQGQSVSSGVGSVQQTQYQFNKSTNQ